MSSHMAPCNLVTLDPLNAYWGGALSLQIKQTGRHTNQ